ncbi:hypothetical protein A7Q09_02510 [Methylacidiphilum sp. Yel]|jgi:hypothetical protein|uniref:hypothetical protein n=1 Tax=Methylacidiphilum sp. Yel TaxID=1847730 RepID=UPI00106C2F1E|nr:hypothetical protein [Methylacidiphilum sp. Yel]TFE65800.1 hypothetical protein A7Q09_02510 [Methylacidiphilum sp. Yel]
MYRIKQLWIYALFLILQVNSLFSLSNQDEIKQKIAAILTRDLYPEAGEKLTILNIEFIEKKRPPIVSVSWIAHLVDDGQHYKPLFHPPSTLDTEEVYGFGQFQIKENHSIDLNNPLSKQSLERWRSKLITIRDLMRQVVILRCMYFCRHNYGKNTEWDLHHALEQLHFLSNKEKPKLP